MASQPSIKVTHAKCLERISEVLSEYKVPFSFDGDAHAKREDECAKKLAKKLDCGNVLAEMTGKLLPKDLPPSEFYQTLGLLRFSVGSNKDSNRAIGLIWLTAVKQLGEHDARQILDGFTDGSCLYFFENLSAFPTLIETLQVPDDYLLDWIEAILDRIGADLCQNSFWDGLLVLTRKRVPLCVSLIEIAITDGVDQKLRVASFLLGNLRRKDIDASAEKKINDIDSKLSRSQDRKLQRCHLGSWATTASQRGLTICELNQLIDCPDDIESVELRVEIGCLIVDCDKLSDRCRQGVLAFIDSSVNQVADEDIKYQVARAVDRLTYTDDSHETDIDWLAWIVRIQPVAVESLGTWSLVERVLSSDHIEKAAILVTFENMSRVSSQQMLSLFRNPMQFRGLMKRLKLLKPMRLVSRLMLSESQSQQELGLYLFDHLELPRISKMELNRASDEVAHVLFYTSQRTQIRSTAIARLLVSLLPRFQKIGGDSMEEFEDLIKMQLLNFSLGFRNEFSRLAGENPLCKGLLQSFDELEERKKNASMSGVARIQVPGVTRAIQLHRRHHSRRIRAASKSDSLFALLCNETQVIYGSAHGSYVDGHLIPPIPFSSVSGSIEMPANEFIDPEGMALRRIRSSVKSHEMPTDSDGGVN